ESEGLWLEPAFVDPPAERRTREWAEGQAAERIAVERIDIELRQLIHREIDEQARTMSLAGVGRLDQPDEVGRAERRRGMGLEEDRLDEPEGRVVLGEQPVAEPVGGQFAGPEVLAEGAGGEFVPVPRLQEPAPRLEPDLLARVARLEEVGGKPSDGDLVV